MKYPEEITAETQQEQGLMQSLYEENFTEDFVVELEKSLNHIGMLEDMSQAKKVALAGYVLIEFCDTLGLEDVRPELLLKALDDASNFEKVVEMKDVEK